MLRKNLITSIILKFSGALVGIIGVLFSIMTTPAGVGGPSSLLFFTLQSNIWIIFIMILFGINDCVLLKKGRGFLNEKWFRVKFVFTVSLTLTFLVFGLLLFPAIPLDYSLSVTSLTLHLIAPIIAIADFAAFDHGRPLERTDIVMALLPPLYYVLFVVACNLIGLRFPPDGNVAPYFFMDYETYGWLAITSSGIGVVYWGLFLFLAVMMIAFSLRAFAIIIQRKMTAKTTRKPKNC
jgi:magnesium-transporting ATPase (P-type)